VACLRATGRRVYAINPMAVTRYRDRHVVSGKKSDHHDAVVLANILRTDVSLHRPLPTDSDPAKAIAVLARAQQDAVWDRTRAHNRLRSHLREYYPAIPEAFAGKRERLLAREARAILAIAPTPAEAARLTCARLKTTVTRAGRQRRIDAETDRLLQVFRRTWLRQPSLVEKAMGRQTLALLAQLDAACQACDDLARDTEELFLQHPDAEIITSFPGPATLTGARILAEIGDSVQPFFFGSSASSPSMNCANTARGSGRLNKYPNEPVKVASSASHPAICSAVTPSIMPGQRHHAGSVTRSPAVVPASAGQKMRFTLFPADCLPVGKMTRMDLSA
jgi:transposase